MGTNLYMSNLINLILIFFYIDKVSANLNVWILDLATIYYCYKNICACPCRSFIGLFSTTLIQTYSLFRIYISSNYSPLYIISVTVGVNRL